MKPERQAWVGLVAAQAAESPEDILAIDAQIHVVVVLGQLVHDAQQGDVLDLQLHMVARPHEPALGADGHAGHARLNM